MATHSLNPLHRSTKTRRLVSAWIMQHTAEPALDRIRQFDGLFDEIVLMCGGIEPGGRVSAGWPIDKRAPLVDALHQMGISVLLDWGGKYSEELGRSLHKPATLKKYIRTLLDQCDQAGADGIDIDIEGWPAIMRNVYTELLVGLSEGLRERDKSLSVCHFSQSRAARREKGIGFIDPVILAPYVDQFRCMTYDLYCPPSQFVGPTSTAPWGRETMNYMVTQVPAAKVVMGLPTYSVDWDINDPTRSRQVNEAAFIAEKEKLSPIGRGWCYFDDVSLIRYSDAEGHAHLLWVSDARSTGSHLVTVDTLDLAGVCFWVLTGTEDIRIWKAVHDHFQR